MSICLDRFAQWLKDQQQGDVELIGHCKYCGNEIFSDIEHVKFDSDVFCDLRCLGKYIGAEEVY